ncbi:MAG: hypothetical protein ACD_22C00120G0001, partial [uncultured bacterium]
MGGKAAGLGEVAEIFGKEFVGDAVVVTSECVTRWLNDQGKLQELVNQLVKEEDVNKKLRLAEKIRSGLARLVFSDIVVDKVVGQIKGSSFAVRSSSFDEDTLVNGTAAGIYESEIGVTREELGVKLVEVISSFFSEKAVSYRHLHGLSDEPVFAVVVQEYISGSGG